MQTSWPESSASQGSPEGLAVGWQFTLAGGRYGDQDHIMLQELLLQNSQSTVLVNAHGSPDVQG